jgi:hypothetical protein
VNKNEGNSSTYFSFLLLIIELTGKKEADLGNEKRMLRFVHGTCTKKCKKEVKGESRQMKFCGENQIILEESKWREFSQKSSHLI